MRIRLNIFVTVILGFLFGVSFFVFAEQITYEFFVDLPTTSVRLGDEFTGKVIARLYHPGPCENKKGKTIIEIDYGDGNTKTIGECSYNLPNPKDYTECIYSFSYKYRTAPTDSLKVSLKCANGSSLATRKFKMEIISPPTETSPGTSDKLISPLKATSPQDLITYIINNLIFKFLLFGFVVMVMVGGYYLISSQGSPDKIQKGKRIIFYAILGLILLLLAWGIIYLIQNVLGVKKK